jgi:lipooligosaccharide transport system permease protein
MVAFPDARSSGLPLAVVGAACCGVAFAAPITAFSAQRMDPSGSTFASLQRFVITPLFLFGGAFYPVDQLPAAIRPIAYVTPLWHAVEFCRGATLHTLGFAAGAGHLAVLAAWTVAGTLPALHLFRRRVTE